VTFESKSPIDFSWITSGSESLYQPVTSLVDVLRSPALDFSTKDVLDECLTSVADPAVNITTPFAISAGRGSAPVS
jgi:hypothetical protein